MSSVEYHDILMYCLMITLFSIDEVYLVFRKACLNTSESTQFIIKSFQDSNKDMNLLEMSFFILLGGQRYLQRKNASVNFFTDPHEERLTLRPPNVIINGYGGENMHV